MNLEEGRITLRFLSSPRDPMGPLQCLKILLSFNNATIPILSTSKAKLTMPQNPEFFHNSSQISSPLLQIHYTAPSGVFKKFTYLSVIKFKDISKGEKKPRFTYFSTSYSRQVPERRRTFVPKPPI